MNLPNMKIPKPLLRGHFHQEAFFFTLGACSMLVFNSYGTKSLLATIIYSLSLVTLFGISALYHRPNWSPNYRIWLKRIDHCAIYIVIAGTFTPICLLVLLPDVGINLLKLVWSAAGLGVLQSLFWVKAPKWLTAILYISVGCFIIPYLPELQSALSFVDTLLIIVGGIVLAFGGLIYVLKKPNPWPKIFGYHEIFHVLTIVGIFLHSIVIVKLIN